MQTKNKTHTYKWDLSKVFKNTTFEKEQGKIPELVASIQQLKGKITENKNNFLNYLKLSEELSTIIGKIGYFLYNQSSSDLSNQDYQKQSQNFSAFLEPYNVKLAFVHNELLNNVDLILDIIKSDQNLDTHLFHFTELKKSQMHKLSDQEEELLAQLSPCLGNDSGIFSKLTGADFIFDDVADSNGKAHKLFQGNAGKLLTDKDLILRKNAYLSFWKTYEQHKHTLALNFFNNIKSTSTFAKIYKYNNSLSMALYDDNISEEFYKNILDSVAKNSNIIIRWKKIIEKITNNFNPSPWDVSGPLFPNSEKKFSKTEAKNIIFKALKNLGPDYANKLKMMLENNLIDWMPSKNKRSGAYSYSVWKSEPYILMNWNGKYSDVSTLIHELGHSIHSLYSNENQNFLNHDYPIFLAEVASIVNEILLIFYLLNISKDVEFKKSILENAIKEFIALIFRQAQFAEFEMITHAHVDNNETLNLDDFQNIAKNLSSKYFPKLPKHNYKDNFGGLWGLYVPHFYTDFYVYKYVTGAISACVLAFNIMSGNKELINKYLTFLKSGGKAHPLKILKSAGVDLENSDDIDKAFKVINSLLEMLENII